MKVIDLLNKIANGEEAPKRIVFRNIKYELQKSRSSNDYYRNDDGEFLMNNIRIMEELNYEVELIEEQQDIDIQAIENLYEWVTRRNGEVTQTEGKILEIGNKLNKLIEAVKQLDRNINKE